MATTTTPIREMFDRSYTKRAIAFANDVAGLDASGMPEPHFSIWGRRYENAPLRLGIIGQDTRSWYDMKAFIQAVKDNPVNAIHRHEEELTSLAFTKWTNNFGKTFMDTTMKIIAGIHGISDWKRLKRREEESISQTFFWANVNSVECFEPTPKANGVSFETWRNFKTASEQHLDSFREILAIFRPHVVFLLNWDPGEPFLDFPLTWTNFGDHQAEAQDPKTGCLILKTAHPTWLNQHGLYDEAINGLTQRAQATLPPTPFCAKHER